MKYCPYRFKTERFKTREVLVGGVGVGGGNPIRIQSMTTSNTNDVEKTVEQILKLEQAGCEIVRVTVQGMKEAMSCEAIKNLLIQKGCAVPLVADIHFFPKAALAVADFVDKVRINPGNFVDKRATFKVLQYTDAEYQEELKRIEEKFLPLIEKCKKNKVAMRIGTNHGSLSDRIMNHYGDSPEGMVESALEYAKIARAHDYNELIFSMKSSNTLVMIQAYRLLAQRMIELGWDYPLHLGVTEAGNGQDGRIKSSVGIGALLLDGLGDTIRISLTEDPWFEIDPAKRLLKLTEEYQQREPMLPFIEKKTHPFRYEKRVIQAPSILPESGAAVVLKVSEEEIQEDDFYQSIGFEEGERSVKSADALLISGELSKEALTKLYMLAEKGITLLSEGNPSFVRIKGDEEIKDLGKASLILLELKEDKVHQARKAFEQIKQQDIQAPVILEVSQFGTTEDLPVRLGAELGALLCEALGDGVCLDAPVSLNEKRELSLSLLQAARLRSSKTEFISCPSCGRTLFDLQEVTRKIQERTRHLPGVKIAIMGCIVNGPGEMADADFGYVGSRPGMIDLYVGKICVERNIAHEDAVERLVDLLKDHGVWQEPKEVLQEGSLA